MNVVSVYSHLETIICEFVQTPYKIQSIAMEIMIIFKHSLSNVLSFVNDNNFITLTVYNLYLKQRTSE